MGARRFKQSCGAAVVLLATTGGIQATDPEFYLIEPFLKVGVLIHFDVQPFLNYDLQSTTNLAAATGQADAPTNSWKSIYKVPAAPFFQHFILPDYFTNNTAQVFYRLAVTP